MSKRTERIGETLAQQGKITEAEGYFREALRRNPASPTAYRNLAVALQQQGKTEEAIARYGQCLQLKNDYAEVLACLAWVRATHPSAKFRDGRAAVELARRAVDLSQGREAWYLKTLAAAYAEAGRMDDAKTTLRQAMALAEKSHDKPQLDSMRELLARFSSGRPYRDVNLTTGAKKGKD